MYNYLYFIEYILFPCILPGNINNKQYTKETIPNTNIIINYQYLEHPMSSNVLIGHLRSKVKVPNKSPVMTSFLKLRVTIKLCLSGTVFQNIGPFINLLIELIKLITMV